MIFKKTSTSFDIDENYKKKASAFTFEILEGETDQGGGLIYPENLPIFQNIQGKFNDKNRLYPDLIAAIYRKMYERGLARRGTIVKAILASSYHLQRKGFRFLGFIRKDDEVSRNSKHVDFVKEWDFEKSEYKIEGGARENSRDGLFDIFSESDFNNSYNVFFVAGSQSFEMLDLRIKKAATLITELKKESLLSDDSVKIVLSGWNNAKATNSKVQFANESLAMRNLLIHKLSHYLDKDLSSEYIEFRIESEVNSRDTSENIRGLIAKLSGFANEAQEQKRKCINLFIVSSTFHLLQLSDYIEKRELEIDKITREFGMEQNIFLVGSENPDHFFKFYDAAYIKLLMNEVIYRDFHFCKSKK